MAASTQQKLDYLLKKIGYTASKTGLAEDSSLSGTKKAPFAESIPSPLVTANSSIWTDSDSIPGTPPGSDSSYVKVYLASASGHRMTVDSTVSGSRAFIAYSTYNNTSTAILGDWIDTQFGDSYIIKVYKGDPNSGGTLLSAAGSGSNDTWFFDYASGVLNFNGTVIPSGVTDTNIYLVGYRYIGAKGTATAGINTSGTSKFTNLNVSGVTTVGFATATDVWVSGAITATTFDGNLATTNLTGTITNAQLAGSIANDKLANSTVSYGGISLALGGTDATPAFNLTDATNYPYTSLTGITTDIVGDTTPQLGGNLDGNSKSIYGVGIITATTLDISGNVDIDGTTELDDVNVSAASTFAGLVDIDAGAQANTLKVEDLTDNRIVIAGTGGELEDTTKLTFDGSTLAVVGDATFSGNVSIAGTLTKEDVTNIDSVGLITARSGVRITAGGLVISSGVATFTDAIDADGGLDVTGGSGLVASTAKVSDLTSGRVVIAGTSGELEDASTLTFSGGTLSATTFSGNLTGTVNTAAQTNITSVGTLTSLDVSGNITGAGDLTLTDTTADSAAGPELKLFRNSASPADADYIGQIKFAGESDTGVERNYAKITGKIGDASNGTEDGILEFAHIKAGSQTITGRWNSTTLQLLNDTALSVAGDITANGNIAGDGSTNITGINAITAAGDITANGNVVGDNSTNISGINSVTATTYYGDGTNLVGVALSTLLIDAGISTTGTAGFTNVSISGIATIGQLYVTGITTLAGNIDLGMGGSDDINVNGDFISGLNPKTTGSFDLGTPGQYWKNLFLTEKAIATSVGTTSLTATGISTLGITSATDLTLQQLNVSGVSTFAGNINANGNIVGDTATNISGINSVTVTTYYGDGSNLTNVGAASTDAWIADSQENLVAGTGAGAARDADTCFNIMLGCNSGAALNAGDDNVFLGRNAGCSNTSGDDNVYIGAEAGKLNVAANNVVIGNGAGGKLTGAADNVYLGYQTGEGLFSGTRTGSQNVALGKYALAEITTGGKNIVLGCSAGNKLTSGGDNIALGQLALGAGAVTGGCNIAIGQKSLCKVTSGVDNVALGVCAGGQITSSNENITIGKASGYALDDADHYNVLLGKNSGCKLGSGGTAWDNVFGGRYSGSGLCSGRYNVFFGPYTGYNWASGGSSNVVIGDRAAANQTAGSSNIVLGHGAKAPISNGSCQLAIGACDGSSTVNYWIVGNASGNVGIGTTNPDTAVGVGNTAKLSVGILSAYQLYGDGSNLTGLAGFSPDDQGNLYAGTDAGAASDADTTCNIAIGQGAGKSLNAGDCNVLIGFCAGEAATQSSRLVAIGYKAAQCAQLYPSGFSNVFIGAEAGRLSCRGQGNVAIGHEALKGGCAYDQEIDNSIFIGQYAGTAVCRGADAIWMGCKVGAATTDAGTGNIWLGNQAGGGAGTDVGNNNIFIGSSAGKDITTGNVNVFMGAFTGTNIESGSYNAAYGRGAGQLLTTGSSNTFLGRYAGCMITTSSSNVVIGMCAGCNKLNATTSEQIAIGAGDRVHLWGECKSFGVIETTIAGIATVYSATGIVSATSFYGDGSNLSGISAGFSPDSQENLYAGTSAGAASDADTCYNIGIGYSAGNALNAGDNNILLGCFAGKALTTASDSIFIGRGAGCKTETGTHNIFIGDCSGANGVVTGTCNIFLGVYAGNTLSSGNANVAIGKFAGQQITTGKGNVIIGEEAGRSSILVGDYNSLYGSFAGKQLRGGDRNAVFGQSAGACLCDGCCNTIMGHCAGKSITDGNKNTFLGPLAGNTNTTGSCNVAIGYDVELPSATGNDQFAIGSGTNHWIAGNANFNVGIGTTNPDISVGVGNTAKLSVGIVSAYQLYGDGTNLTGVGGGTLISGFTVQEESSTVGTAGSITILDFQGASVTAAASGANKAVITVAAGGGSTDGWIADSQENLYAGTGAGANSTSDSCYNVAIGYKALNTYASDGTFVGCNVAIGKCAGFCVSGSGGTGLGNVYLGNNAGRYHNSNNAVFIGHYTMAQTAGASGGADSVIIGARAGQCMKSNIRQVAIGCGAGKENCSGDSNSFVGQGAGQYNKTGSHNTFVGGYAGRGASASTAAKNTAIGKYAGRCLTSGACNTFLGTYAGDTNTSGSRNIAIGYNVELPSATGDDQLAIGSVTNHWIVGNANMNVGIGTTNPDIAVGVGNTAKLSVGIVSAYQLYGDGQYLTNVGGGATDGWIADAQYNLVAGECAGANRDADTERNVIIGTSAGCKLNAGDYNVFLGANAGYYTTTGNTNFYGGYAAGVCNQSGDKNVAIGSEALKGTGTPANNTGGCNVAIGRQAGKCMKSGADNIALGQLSLGGANVTGSSNVVIGKESGKAITSGASNILIGCKAGDAVTTGSNHVAIGVDALSAEDTLSGAIAIGYEALKLQNGASGNTVIGCGAGAAITTAGENTLIGWSAGAAITGTTNTIIGALAMSSASSGASNVAIGQDAGRNNTGDNNVIIGATAGDAAGAGEQNTFVGRNSGSAVTDGQSNTFLGMNAGNSTTTGNGNVMIGANVCLANGNCSFAIGRGTSYWIQGDSSFNTTVNTICASNFNSTSDIRLKTNIQPIGDPIGKVKQIEGVSFNWKKDNKPALGVIADQVEEILPELVHGDDPKTVNYNGLIGLLIETVKEQQNQIDELNERISKLE